MHAPHEPACRRDGPPIAQRAGAAAVGGCARAARAHPLQRWAAHPAAALHLSCRLYDTECAHACLGLRVQVHGDVFRPPKYLEVLSALVGTGVQLALLVLSVILITIAGACLPGAACVGLQAWLGRCVAAAARSFLQPSASRKLPSASPGEEASRVEHSQRLPVSDIPGAARTTSRPAGTLFVERGTIVTVFIICYALTSFVGG